MKYVKVLGLLAIAAAALTAFVGSASATELTSSAAKTKITNGTKLHAVSEKAVTFDDIGVVCNQSTFETEVTNEGGPALTVKTKVNTLNFFEECNGDTVTVLKPGTFEIHSKAGTNGNDGTLTSSGAEITFLLHDVILGTIHCIYVTNNTDLGTITSSRNNGNATATIDVSSAEIPRVTTDFGCPTNITWTGNYEIDATMYLDVD